MPPRFIVLLFLSALAIPLLSRQPYSEDDLTHWLIAREAPHRPELFLHLWGRPGFTLLHAPVAQFGFYGSRLLSVALTLTMAALVAGTVRVRRLAPFAWVAVLFQTTTFELADGALTETVHATALALALWLLKRERWIGAALAFSWAAISRFEGMALMPYWALVVALQSWKRDRSSFRILGVTFLMGSLPLVWNAVAFAATGCTKPLAIFTENMFVTARNAHYGSGSWAKFLIGAPRIHGPILAALILIGCVAILRRRPQPLAWTRWSLALALLLFYVMQSAFWAKGLFRTGGYYRFFASIAPVAALVAVDGFSCLRALARKHLPRALSARVIRAATPLLAVSSAALVLSVSLWDDWRQKETYGAVERANRVLRERFANEPHPFLLTNTNLPFRDLDLDLWDESHALPLEPEAFDHAPVGAYILFAGYPPEPGQSVPITFFYAADELARFAEHDRRGERYIHLLKTTRPEFEELADFSLLGEDPATEPWPHYVKIFRLRATLPHPGASPRPVFRSPYLWAR